MTLQTLYCDACGSRDLVRMDDERYRCSHCGASALVSEARATARGPMPRAVASRGWLFGAAGLFLAALFAVVLWRMNHSLHADREVAIDPATIRLSAPHAVTDLNAPTHRDKLLLMVTNQGQRAIRPPQIVARFYDGTTRLETASGYAQTGVMLPGDSSPVLIDVPRQRGTRHEIVLGAPPAAAEALAGPIITFAQYRLVERDGRFKLAALVKAPAGKHAMQSCRASILLLDSANAPIAIGDGRCRVRDLPPGESTTVDASFVRFSGAAVAAMRYHIDYELTQPPPAPPRAVAAANREVMVAGAAERIATSQSWDAPDLLRAP
ncbi:MAG: hypothetical protein JNL19_01710 [Burkholderiales bacterium]|nr:hypothetical protein [Burkholderiales bacterium]